MLRLSDRMQNVLVLVGLAALLAWSGGCGASSAGPAASLPADPAAQEPDTEQTPEDGEGGETLVSRNEGGEELAARVGGTTWTGNAEGSAVGGSLSVTFAADGTLTSMGGAVLGEYFDLPPGSELFFDYGNDTVNGTYGNTPEVGTLENTLAASGQSVEILQVVVTLAGNSLAIRTVYRSNLPGPSAGDQIIDVEATLRPQANDTLQGALLLPGHLDEDVPVFTLEPQ